MKLLTFFLFTIVFVLPLRAQVDLNNGLVSWISFSGNTLDVSGNALHGFPENGGLFTIDRYGQAGQAFYLDGLDDFVRIPDPGALSTTPFSVSIWFKADAARLQALMGKRNFGPFNEQQFQIALFGPGPYSVTSAVVSNAIPCSADLTADVISRTTLLNAFCRSQWHSVIVTYDGQWHRMYFDGALVSELRTNFTQMLSCNADLRIGNWWSGDPLSFQGAVDDFRWYNRQLTNDEIAALASRQGILEPGAPDFGFRVQSLCPQPELAFQAFPPAGGIYQWSFSDGSPSVNQANPVHRFPTSGEFDVTLVSGDDPVCRFTVTKRVDLRLNTADILQNADTTFCSASTIRLRGDTTGILCRQINGSPIPGGILDPVLVSDSSHIEVKGIVYGPELVRNGNFSAGGLGFTSVYSLAAQRSGDGQYAIVSNAQQWDPSINCVDCSGAPAGGTGAFLIADGSPLEGQQVWQQVLTVAPNTTYRLEFTGIGYDPGNPALPGFVVNGVKMDTWIDANGTGRWSTYQLLWNSGKANTLTLSVVNSNLSATGNRFGIDNISVREARWVTDAFTATVDSAFPLVTSADTSVCPGSAVSLAVSGGASYQWFPAEGLNDATAPNPLASPLVTTRYTVRASRADGCKGVDSVLVTVFDPPAISILPDTSLCEGSSIVLTTSGAEQFSWSPATGLSNPGAPSPEASPIETTRYRVRFTESTGCEGEDSVLVTVNAIPVINASSDTRICAGERTTLEVSGGLSYRWFPATGLSDANAVNPVASPTVTTRYYVRGFGAGQCFAIDSVLVRVEETPMLTIRSDTVICQGSSVSLNASGATRYEWSPAIGLSDPFVASPVASPLVTTEYTVTGFGPTGCSATRSMRLTVGADAARVFIPTAFTPNGDGLNDCIQVNGGGGATVFEFAIYNRFGERVFFSRTPGDCWDGNFRGQPQPSGTFAYYLIIDSPCGPAKLKGTITLVR